MPRPPTPKKPKPPKPDFVFPPGGAALAAVPGLRLKPRTGDVPRWWPVDKPGKAPFACNVVGVSWGRKDNRWLVQHVTTSGKLSRVGCRASFEDACSLRTSLVDGHAKKGELVIVSGQLCVTICAHNSCKRKNVNAAEFAPAPCKFKKLFHQYDKALESLATVRSTSVLEKVESLRRTTCSQCRLSAYELRYHGEHSEFAKCLDTCKRIKEGWASQGGCVHCGCKNPCVLQGDHKNRQGKVEYAQVLDPSYWVNHGGSAAMSQHYEGKDTEVEPACGFCHSLLDSHDIYNRSSTATPGTDAYRNRMYRLEKQSYVNKYKVSKQMCEHPDCCDPRTGTPRTITMENVHAFHCAHIDEINKDFTICKMVKATRPLVSVREELDKELDKCKIYCANCHHLYDTLPRLKEGRELLDALLARGAPVACEVCE